MKKGLFGGWKEVFNFTFKQGVEVKGFKGATIGVGILLFVLTFALNGVLAFVKHLLYGFIKELFNNQKQQQKV